MNIQLSSTEEYIDGKNTGTLGQVLIRYGARFVRRVARVYSDGSSIGLIDIFDYRCNNVLWISADKGVKQEDAKMEG